MNTEECMPQVRWLKRSRHYANSASGINTFETQVLQQKWKIMEYEEHPHGSGANWPVPTGVREEWRDVPVVTE
jgi:hypothetical protein